MEFFKQHLKDTVQKPLLERFAHLADAEPSLDSLAAFQEEALKKWWLTPMSIVLLP